MTTEEARPARTREGVPRPLYALVRALVVPFMRVPFRMHIARTHPMPGALIRSRRR